MNSMTDDVRFALAMLLYWLGPRDRDDLPHEVESWRDIVQDWIVGQPRAPEPVYLFRPDLLIQARIHLDYAIELTDVCAERNMDEVEIGCTMVGIRNLKAIFVDMLERIPESIPTAPEPDWSEAPHDATHYAIHANGWSAFYGSEPHRSNDGWYTDTGPLQWVDRIEIPLGVDWRLCVWTRPEEDE